MRYDRDRGDYDARALMSHLEVLFVLIEGTSWQRCERKLLGWLFDADENWGILCSCCD